MYMYMYVCHTLYIVHICIYIVYNIPRQLTCMKLYTGTRELYQPIQSCHVICRYPTNLLQYPDRTAFTLLRGSCCPVWALQHMHVYTLFTCMYVYVMILVVKGFALLKLLTDTWALNYSSNYDHTTTR